MPRRRAADTNGVAARRVPVALKLKGAFVFTLDYGARMYVDIEQSQKLMSFYQQTLGVEALPQDACASAEALLNGLRKVPGLGRSESSALTLVMSARPTGQAIHFHSTLGFCEGPSESPATAKKLSGVFFDVETRKWITNECDKSFTPEPGKRRRTVDVGVYLVRHLLAASGQPVPEPWPNA